MGANNVLTPVKSCFNCGGGMHSASGELTFERNGLVVTVQDVPMSVCDACGERYVPGPLGVEIGDAVDGFIRYFETEAAKPDAVAQPRSLVMTASERVGLLFGT